MKSLQTICLIAAMMSTVAGAGVTHTFYGEVSMLWPWNTGTEFENLSLGDMVTVSYVVDSTPSSNDGTIAVYNITSWSVTAAGSTISSTESMINKLEIKNDWYGYWDMMDIYLDMYPVNGSGVGHQISFSGNTTPISSNDLPTTFDRSSWAAASVRDGYFSWGEVNGSIEEPSGANFMVTSAVVPEPTTMALLGLGGLFFRRRKKA